MLLTAWNISLFAYLDFLRATHPVKNLAFCVPRLFACYSPLWSLSLLACLDFLRAAHHHVVVVSFWRQRTFRLIGLPLLSTCARMFNSTSLAVSHCLRTSTFASCTWTRLGSIFCAWDQTSSVESACDVGDWGPRLRHSPVRPHESQELDARSTDAQPWAGESAQGMDGLRRAGTGLRCFLLNLVFTRNTILRSHGSPREEPTLD